MPTPKRPPAKPRPKTAIAVAPAGLTNATTFTELRSRARDYLAGLKTAIQDTPVTVILPQDLIHAAGILSALQTDLYKAWNEIKVAMRCRKAAGGRFEQGSAVIVFKGSDRRVPAWKDEATRLAAELAKIKNEPFDEDLYHDQVTAATPAVATADAVSIILGA